MKTTPKKKVKKTAGLVLNKEQEETFEILRVLRAEIAREEKVPPYIVFSDKTLVQMCIEKPTNKNAMLKFPVWESSSLKNMESAFWR